MVHEAGRESIDRNRIDMIVDHLLWPWSIDVITTNYVRPISLSGDLPTNMPGQVILDAYVELMPVYCPSFGIGSG